MHRVPLHSPATCRPPTTPPPPLQVDAATGRVAPTAESEFESKVVAGLLTLFIAILVEGLLLSASVGLKGGGIVTANWYFSAFFATVVLFTRNVTSMSPLLLPL